MASVGGVWTNGGLLSATSSTLNLGSGNLFWRNTGMINVTNSTVNLGGTFTTGGLGAFERDLNTVVRLVGTLDNTASTLDLNARGLWYLAGGYNSRWNSDEHQCRGARRLDSVSIFPPGGVLDGITLDAPLRATGGAQFTVINGLELK